MMKPTAETGQLLEWERGDDVDGVSDDVDLCEWVHKLTNRVIYLPVDIKPTIELIYVTLKAQRVETLGYQLAEIQTEKPVDNAVDRISLILTGSEKDGRSEIKVYRVKDGGKENFCASYKPEEFENGDLSIIQKQFGGGNYRIRVYATDSETNKFVIRANQLVEIEQPLMSIHDKNDGSNAGLMQIMMRHIENSDKRFEQLMQQKSGESEKQSMTEKLTEFKLMKDVFGSDSRPQNSVLEMMQTLNQVKELSLMFNKDEKLVSDNSELLELGKTGLDLMSKLVAPQPTQIKIPENVSVQYFPETKKLVETENTTIMNLYKPYFEAILIKAGEKADVNPIADDLIKLLPESVFDELEKDTWFEYLRKYMPTIDEHKDWFVQLREALFEPDVDESTVSVLPSVDDSKTS